MRVLNIGNHEGVGWDGSITDENNIADALEELGHNVARVQRETAYDDIVKNWGNPVFDFVLIAQWDNYDDRLWSMLPHPRVYWAFDYQADGQAWHKRLIAEADLYLSKRIADSKYPDWQWLSQDFAPAFLSPYAIYDNAEPIDVLFTGSYLPWATERNETIKAVNDRFDLEVYSVNDWPFLERKPPRMDHDLPELYARARVILSIDHTLEAGYWSDRNAQIMACGRRPLFRYVPLSEARFGDRVDYFYSIDDCLEKIANRQSRPTNADGLFVKDRVQDLLTIVRSVL